LLISATDKSFTSLTQAEAFLTSTGPIPASGPPKFYAVRHGHEPGIYSDWHTAQKQITGYQKPQHKKFSTRAEAEAYLRRPSPTIETVRPAVADADAARATSRVKNEDAEDEEAPAAKRRTATRLTAGEADAAAAAAADMLLPLGWAAPPADAADGHDYTLTIDAASGQLRRKTAAELDALTVRPANAGPAAAAATSSKTANRGGPLNVWTDGACRANGQRGAIAGVGVYFGPRDPKYAHLPPPTPHRIAV
jgi:ribonuclease HI